jgi:hypothetical protein
VKGAKIVDKQGCFTVKTRQESGGKKKVFNLSPILVLLSCTKLRPW